ncbi:hypothetical protein APSETT445_009111 [Aspergillus pseudonomiae]
MSWFHSAQGSARNEGYRDGKADALRELKSEQAREISNTRRACLEELLQEDPENIYYSSNDIRYMLARFYLAVGLTLLINNTGLVGDYQVPQPLCLGP